MRDKILEIHKLMLEYPGMPVKMFVASDELLEDYPYTSHEIKSVELAQWYELDEYVYIDEDELAERFMEDLGTEEEKAREMARECLIDVIMIKTGA